MPITNTMEALLAEGFSRKLAGAYLDALAREDKSDLFDPAYREWAHSNGFFAESASAYGLSEDNIGDYLSDHDYYKVWPINGWQRIWINDKLTLKYMLHGTEFEHLMPRYYFYADQRGLFPLLDEGGVAQILAGGRPEANRSDALGCLLDCLRSVGELAVKPCNGEKALGFHKLSWTGSSYLVDNAPATEADVRRFVDEHGNDLYTEFLHPGGGLELVSPVIHTLRVLVVNQTGVDPTPVAAYFRFASGVGADDSKANYRLPRDAGTCSYDVDFDLETGEYGGGRLVYANKVVMSPKHPDTGVLAEGTYPNWAEVRAEMLRLSCRLGPVEYMGFDLSETTDGPKLMEINSHSGCKYLQVFRPFRRDAFLSAYFDEKLAQIDALDDEVRTRRNNTMR